MTLPIRSSLPRIRRSGFPASALLAAGLLLGGWTAGASADDRDYLQGKLAFRYVHQPNTTSSTPEVLDNAAVAAGTETGTFWSNTQVPGCTASCARSWKPAGRGGDGHLQFVAAQIIKILDKPVIIMLLNDVGTPLTTAAFSQWDACDNGSGRAGRAPPTWTRATTRGRTARAPPGTPRARAPHGVGGTDGPRQTVFVSDPGWATSTFIHELVHTQDRSDRRAHVLGEQPRLSLRRGRNAFGVEAVPNLAATYPEGSRTRSPRRERAAAHGDVQLVLEQRRRREGARSSRHGSRLHGSCYTVVTAPSPTSGCTTSSARRAPGADRDREPARRATPTTGSGPAGALHRAQRVHPVPDLGVRAAPGALRFMQALKANDATLFRVSTSPVAQLYSTLCSIGLEGRPLSSVVGVNEAGPSPISARVRRLLHRIPGDEQDPVRRHLREPAA